MIEKILQLMTGGPVALAIAVKATVAIVLTFALVAVARRARASMRHLLLASLFVFLLLLPFASQFIEMQLLAFPVDVAPTPSVERSADIVSAAPPASSRQDAGGSADWKSAFRYGYVSIAGLLLAWLFLGVLRLSRMAANGEVWLEGTARMNELAAQSGIRRAALVILSNETAVPLTFGFRRSTIVLPEAAREWSDDELCRALRHELEHVRREDWAAQLIARAACAIYWAHPLVWVAWRRFCFEAERACDDAVVGTFEGAEDYAGQLVSLARSVRVSFVPALGMASRSRLSQRVHALLDRSQRRGPLGRLAMMMTMAVTLVFLVTIAPMRLIAAAREDDGERTYKTRRWSQLGEILAELGEKGDIEGLRHYLDGGIDVNTVADGDGTALIGAAKGGHLECARFLVSRGADVNLASSGDGNPLIVAAEGGHLDVVEYLLDQGANINTIVPGDENPLIQAAWKGHEDVVELLIRRRADVNVRCWERDELRTPLRMAKREGHENIVRILIAAGARD